MLNTAASDARYEGGRAPHVFGFFDFSSFHRFADAPWRPRRAPAANNAPDAFPASAHRPPILEPDDELSAFFARQRVHDGVVSIDPDSSIRTYFEWHVRTDRGACCSPDASVKIVNSIFPGSFRRQIQTRNIHWHDTRRYSICRSAGLTEVANRIICGPDTWNVVHNAFKGALHNICRSAHFAFLRKNAILSVSLHNRSKAWMLQQVSIVYIFFFFFCANCKTFSVVTFDFIYYSCEEVAHM